MKAIIYTSNTGYTEQYAKLLGEEIMLPVYNLEDGLKNVEKGSDIIYFGWMMAGNIKSYKKVKNTFNVKALCGVGMTFDKGQAKELKEKYNVGDNTEVFYLQGGFDMKKLRGMYKLMMKGVKKVVLKKLAKKEALSDDEKKMIELLNNGGSCVSKEKLKPIIDFVNNK